MDFYSCIISTAAFLLPEKERKEKEKNPNKKGEKKKRARFKFLNISLNNNELPKIGMLPRRIWARVADAHPWKCFKARIDGNLSSLV